jgi:hypothetical protein
MDQPTVHTPDLRPDVAALDLGALSWRTSSYSSGHGGNCVEVAPVPSGGVVVRNSKEPAGPVVGFSTTEWDDFIDGATSGEFRFPW